MHKYGFPFLSRARRASLDFHLLHPVAEFTRSTLGKSGFSEKKKRNIIHVRVVQISLIHAAADRRISGGCAIIEPKFLPRRRSPPPPRLLLLLLLRSRRSLRRRRIPRSTVESGRPRSEEEENSGLDVH